MQQRQNQNPRFVRVAADGTSSITVIFAAPAAGTKLVTSHKRYQDASLFVERPRIANVHKPQSLNVVDSTPEVPGLLTTP